MILELTWRWPFIRRHACAAKAEIPAPGQSRHGTPHHAHRSWVRTEHGVGWIHHHETSGYWVEFADGRLLQCKSLAHISSAEAIR